ncbi:cysteine desulfurase NifS [Candidatus Peregrinibacteria bacterium CG10_big_fil_rev_8_21_14_0_10_49_24]|nr:MAG: cysteine desulfurase NifS [Candidatus Peregrinibacteria bacterium CG11_big_fil_rev_8_21_14_0_20_49_14]PIR51248.1 MAG: cysteine desulfurase NifS [Candidatus Peregrinibacteria bacterium CG10_big_fil_rev_8_21_14_0_10_49_24]PJA67658.1 MAG: cysteine desulfurase NifS [Candidatus Peregrinibacteria bacterium CG_4_9_14_3_um_filter_49_12]
MLNAMIYLDHAATSPLDPRVLEAMLPHLRDTWGNPSSPHAKGREARIAIDTARQSIADRLGVLPHEIVFVSSGSEGNSLAMFGSCERWLQTHEGPGHLITASVEHSCSLKAADKLEAAGWKITKLPVDAFGMLSATDLEDALTEDTALVSLQWANNEVGTIQPVEELAAVCKKAGVPFHCDAVQGVGLLPLPSPVPDLMTIAAHKFYGPKGIGVLVVREHIELCPQVMGGGQEFGLRAGTENTAGIVGMAAALELCEDKRQETTPYIRNLRDILVSGILSMEGTSLNGHPEHRLPNFANIRFEGLSAENILMKLDMAGICVSSGAACVTGAIEASHVLTAMGRSATEAKENIRFSLGKSTTEKEIETVLQAIQASV